MASATRVTIHRDRVTLRMLQRRLFVRALCVAMTRATGNTLVMVTSATTATAAGETSLAASWANSNQRSEIRGQGSEVRGQKTHLECRDSNVAAFLFLMNLRNLRIVFRVKQPHDP